MIRIERTRTFQAVLALFFCLSLAAAGCKGSRGPQGPPGASAGPAPPTGPAETDLGDGPTGVIVEITSVAGGSGPTGAFQVGDTISITFTLRTDDGRRIPLSALDFAGVMVSGPTFNYQRVIARLSNVIDTAVENSDGSFTFSFPAPIPAAYLPPLNDTKSFGPGDGELAGTLLLSGTYTVGLEAYRNVTVDGGTIRDPGNATRDFLFGTAAAIEPREVVTLGNCNQCHNRLEAHGGSRVDVKLCLLCHTTGSEDRNVPAVERGTPGVSIDFRVMIHRIHNGSHLPSVLGVATKADGTRDYSAPPAPYKLVGFQNRVFDFSEVGFPVWPNLSSAMPRDQGYTALTAAQKAVEDKIRGGVTSCEKCHGDPDDSGPLPAPAAGELAYVQSTRGACGSCHDDVDWSRPYIANLLMMPAQRNDAACTLCHQRSGDALAVRDAHLHPLYRTDMNPGFTIDLLSVSESGTNDGDGTVDPGEKIAVTFAVKDDAGQAVPAAAVASLNALISGPTKNRQLFLSGSIPAGALTGTLPYTIHLPQPLAMELVGRATSAVDVFSTSRTPHWNMTGAATTVQVRTGTGAGSAALAASTPALENTIEVTATVEFARGEVVVFEDGVAGQEEYATLSLVEAGRLWFNPPLRYSHAAGASVLEVALTSKKDGTDYTLNAASGQISEVTEFGENSAVLVSYTIDFVMPSVYTPPLNDSPDLDESWGEWKGKRILDGTYTVGLWGFRNVVVALHGETQTYRGASPAANRDFLVGAAASIEPYGIISSGENCNACHSDVLFHGGGRRGFDNCIHCHGVGGGEDRPRFVAGNAPATTGVTIDFRTLLHKIHRGRELANASSYTVVGFGAAPYPDNYSPLTFSEIGFPVMPDGVKSCETCHGTSTAWKEPSPRTHPDQASPTRAWFAACNSCHDSSAAEAHAIVQTASGVESCAVCHGPGRAYDVEWAHGEF